MPACFSAVASTVTLASAASDTPGTWDSLSLALFPRVLLQQGFGVYQFPLKVWDKGE